ncbi:MAG: VWA domain-containing protein [Proteobacteria bacterium]|nr:VWA domain-containing protein [Pseudomonadota bacterium]
MSKTDIITQALPVVLSMMGETFGVKVNYGPFQTASTDGKVVNIPSLPLDDKKAAILAYGFGEHEVAHIRFTEVGLFEEAAKISPLAAHILNTLEDPRIEHCMIKRYPGCKSDLARLSRQLLDDNWYPAVDDETPPVQLFMSYLMVKSRVVILNTDCLAAKVTEYGDAFDKTFPSGMRSKVDTLIEAVRYAQSTRDVWETTQALLQLLEDEKDKAANPPPPPMPQNSPDEPQDAPEQSGQPDDQGEGEKEPENGSGDESDDNGNDDDSTNTTNTDDDAGNESDSGQPGDDSDEAENESDAGNSSDEDDPADDDAGNESDSGQPGDDSDEAEDSDQGQGTGTDSESDADPSQDSASESKSGGGNAQADPDGLEELLQALSEVLDAEESDLPEDMSERIAQELADISQNTSSDEKAGMARESHCDRFDLDASKVALATTALRSRLQGLLQAEAVQRVQPRRVGRRLDTRVLARTFVGDMRIFKGRSVTHAIDTAVHVLVDRSLSMEGSRMDLANLSCLALKMALESVQRINLGITAFPAGTAETETVYPLLRHGEKAFRRSNFGIHGKGWSTPLAEALWWVFADLAKQPDQRRVCFVLTDGEPDSVDATKTVIREMEKAGIEMIGLGIQHAKVENLFRNHTIVQNLDELPKAVFETLQNVLLRHKAA